MRSFHIGLQHFILMYLATLVATPLSALAVLHDQRSMDAISPSGKDDWPMMRHDSRNTGQSRDRIAPPLRLLWRVPTYRSAKPFLLSSGGVVAVTSNPTNVVETPEVSLYDRYGHRVRHLANAVPVYLKGERIVVAVKDAEGTVPACYDWHTNERLWSQPLARQSGFGTACEKDGRLYWAQQMAGHSVLRILDLRDGQVLKETFTEEGWGSGPPACDGEHVYWGVSHWLHVLDANTLEHQWAYYDGGNAYPMPVGSFLFIQGWSHGARALDLTVKKPVWGVSAWRGAGHALATGRDGRQVIVEAQSIPDALTGIDASTGDVLWRHPLLLNSGAIDEGMAASCGRFVYVPGWHWGGRESGFGGFYCVDAVTGKLRWKYERLGVRGIAIIVSEDHVYGLDSVGRLYCFGPRLRR